MDPHNRSGYMRKTRFESKRTADIAGLGAFPEAFGLMPDFFVSRLEDPSTLGFAFGFGIGRGFFAFVYLSSLSESSWSLASLSVFLRLLGFAPALGSVRAVRFFEVVGISSSVLSA